MPHFLAQLLQQLDADAFEHVLALRRAEQRALVGDPDVAGRGLGEPAVAEHDGLQRAVVGRHLPRQHVAQQADALDVAALPAEVARLVQATPWWRCSAVAGFIGLTIMKTVGVRPSGITWSRGATPRVTWM
jgi:hypothetical protein